MKIYDLEKGIDEGNFDKVKAAVLSALVNENLIDKEVANDWCLSHTIMVTKRNWFCSLLGAIHNSKAERDEYHIKVVKIIV